MTVPENAPPRTHLVKFVDTDKRSATTACGRDVDDRSGDLYTCFEAQMNCEDCDRENRADLARILKAKKTGAVTHLIDNITSTRTVCGRLTTTLAEGENYSVSLSLVTCNACCYEDAHTPSLSVPGTLPVGVLRVAQFYAERSTGNEPSCSEADMQGFLSFHHLWAKANTKAHDSYVEKEWQELDRWIDSLVTRKANMVKDDEPVHFAPKTWNKSLLGPMTCGRMVADYRYVTIERDQVTCSRCKTILKNHKTSVGPPTGPLVPVPDVHLYDNKDGNEGSVLCGRSWSFREARAEAAVLQAQFEKVTCADCVRTDFERRTIFATAEAVEPRSKQDQRLTDLMTQTAFASGELVSFLLVANHSVQEARTVAQQITEAFPNVRKHKDRSDLLEQLSRVLWKLVRELRDERLPSLQSADAAKAAVDRHGS